MDNNTAATRHVEQLRQMETGLSALEAAPQTTLIIPSVVSPVLPNKWIAMSKDHLVKLTLQLSASEVELFEQAAQVTGKGKGKLSSWAKETLLKHAESIVPKRERQFDGGIKILPASPPPHCFCGGTQDPRGDCDGSCIMRY